MKHGPKKAYGATSRYRRNFARQAAVLSLDQLALSATCPNVVVQVLTAFSRLPFSPSMSDLAIDIRNVVKRYEEHVAVRDLSLQVPRGSVYGLLGPNGAGKTTTIRMILDIILPDSGSINLFGVANTAAGIMDRVGYLPEERGLYKKMQVRRVLLFLAELKGISPAEATRRIDEWLDRFSLRTPEKDWGEAKVDELSRGMQQKVQFIATLLHDPDLVILDEPFSGLDPINAQALKDAVLELKRRGKTVIFSTHMMDNAEKMCDSVCIIARGEKVLDGRVTDVKRAASARHVALSLVGGAQNGVTEVLHDTQSRPQARRQCELHRARARSGRRFAGAAPPPARGRRKDRPIRDDAALAAPNLPSARRCSGHRDGNVRPWIRKSSSSPSANTSSACARDGSSS